MCVYITFWRNYILIPCADGYVPAGSFFDYPFYGALSLAYLVFGLLWLVACTLHSEELIKLQYLITAGVALGMIETSLMYSHFHSWNEHGSVSASLLAMGMYLLPRPLSLSNSARGLQL